MSDEDLDHRSQSGLRLVSDEGRTVAESPQTDASPFHPSVPDRNNQSDEPDTGSQSSDSSNHGDRSDNAADLPAELAGSAVADLDGEATPDGSHVPSSHVPSDRDLCAAVEAVLIVATEPVSAELLACVTAAQVASVEATCEQLAREYASAGRGFTLERIAGGYQVLSAASCAEYVERFVGSRRSRRLSAAAMETLAVVAYKQPISRTQISAVRGVNADGVVRTLTDQGYIAEVGRDLGPGAASLLGTTDLFLERLGLDGLEDLPSLAGLSVDADATEEMDRLAVGGVPSAGDQRG